MVRRPCVDAAFEVVDVLEAFVKQLLSSFLTADSM